MIRVALLGAGRERSALRTALAAPGITVVGADRLSRLPQPHREPAAPGPARADLVDLVLLAAAPDRPAPLTAVRALRSRPAAPPVVVLASAPGAEYIAGCLTAGAAGVLDPGADRAVLLSCLRILASGGRVFPAPAARVRTPAPDTRPAGHRDARPDTRRSPGPAAGDHRALTLLTHRQREVLCLLAAGLTNPAISARLGIAPATVKEHVSATLRKLGVSNRTSAAVLAHRAGWTDGGRPPPAAPAPSAPPEPAVPPTAPRLPSPP
ncbi:response regulator transcription factor [Streptomyces sp. S07_1.15]|uniref:response regulator transcription factor n=1 Tax=Streptomyces sp. S07_1.15 TaxID=2873925 RepID=UPI001D13DEA2|nr:response regulator transcription factor [Streptomyces sp. S07_1.15]MCC3651653.1 response regulator transcription factor [Streptomyces sp. S07_1.15]